MQRTGLVYARISVDDEDDGRGVARHERIARRLAAENDIPIVGVFSDNDITGSGTKRRPDYEGLLDAIRTGQGNTVLVSEVERLQRGLREYLQFFELGEQKGLLVIWEGGRADFRTGEGIDALEDRATDARKELRKIRRRVKNMHADLLEQRAYVGPKRTFGYRSGPDGAIVRDEPEATIIREAWGRLVGGEGLRTICREFETRGIVGVKGRPLTASTLKRIMVSGRISARRDFGETPEGGRMPMPRIVGPIPGWPAIITPEQSDRVRAILSRPEGEKRAEPRRYLLSGGMTRCALCGTALRPLRLGRRQRGKMALVCRSGLGFGGCGQIQVMMQPVEDLVSAAVLASIERGALAQLLRRQDDGGQSLADQLATITERLRQLGREWAAGDPFAEGAKEALVARRQKIEAQLESRRRALHLEDLPPNLVDRWSTLPLHQRRAVIVALAEAVLVHPKGQNGGPRFDPSRISILWRA